MPKGKLIINGRFEWWSEKEAGNVAKHGYTFREILPVFNDRFFYEIFDIKHSTKKQTRYLGLGSIADRYIVLQVSYTDEKRIHIISARDATRKEREVYFERLRRLYRQV
ncbi:BrnT family toxin [Treponema sp. OMZ 840]|uniref:BrnT family toxin n=1 Tax=Treponema sp. OMZ 840 TaxID=244313 RepID=UPI003D91854C